MQVVKLWRKGERLAVPALQRRSIWQLSAAQAAMQLYYDHVCLG